jgi:hypothetical protein
MPREGREQGFEDEDEGQRPRVPLPGVRRFGPEDPAQDEAAAFGAVGAGRAMRRMIDHHRRLFPAGDRAMLRRKWDEPRSEALLDHIDAVGEALGIENLEGVGVRGTTDRTRIVTLVTRGQGGRVHKSYLPYSVLDSDGLAVAKAACEKAANIAEARRKGMVVGVTPTDQSADLAELQAQNADLVRRLDALEGGDGAAAGDEPMTVTDIKDAIDAASDDEREAVKAQFREAEEARAEPRKGVLDATEPAGD